MCRPSDIVLPESLAGDLQSQHGGDPQFLRRFHLRNLQRAKESALIRKQQRSVKVSDLFSDDPYTYDAEFGYQFISLFWKWIRSSGQAEALATVAPSALHMPTLGSQWELSYCPLRRFLRNFPREPQNFKSPEYLAQLQHSAANLFHALTGSVMTSCASVVELLEREVPGPSERMGNVNIAEATLWMHKCFQHALATTEERYSQLCEPEPSPAVNQVLQGIDSIDVRTLVGNSEPASSEPSAEAQQEHSVGSVRILRRVGVSSVSPGFETVRPPPDENDPVILDGLVFRNVINVIVRDLLRPNVNEVATRVQPAERAPGHAHTAEDLQRQHGLVNPPAPRGEPAANVQAPPTEPRADRGRTAAAAQWNRGRNHHHRGRGGNRGRRGGNGGAGRNGRHFNNGLRNGAQFRNSQHQPAQRPQPVYRRVVPAFMPAPAPAPAAAGEFAMDEAAVSAAWDEPHVHWQADEEELRARVLAAAVQLTP